MTNERASENCVTVHYVFIVSRDHAWLHRYLVERFNDDPDVEVILDRRVGDRRMQQSAVPTEHERRNHERRRAIPPQDDLRVRSHYIVEL
jgi:hypothetical protein